MLYLREANDSDLELTMAWRSNPDIYQGFYQQKAPLTWDEHLNWWKSRNQNWRTFIIVLVSAYRSRNIGVINIGQLDHWSPEIGWYIGEVSLWNKGYGKKAVKLGLNWLRERGYKFCHTTIKIENGASAKLAWGVGFQMQSGAREGEVWLTKSL